MASSSSTMASKKITLKSSDGDTFDVDENAAMLSQTIKNMIEHLGDSSSTIPLPNVSSATLRKIIEYCNKHSAIDDELEQWDEKFLQVDDTTLADLILAANYMEIKSLLDLTCQCLADKLKLMTVEEVRAKFHIKNDYTPEEEAQVRSENQWALTKLNQQWRTSDELLSNLNLKWKLFRIISIIDPKLLLA